MVNKETLLADERCHVYWFLSDCFLQMPTATSSSEIGQALQIPANELDVMELRKEFTRLFRGIQEGYGPPPPYESLYRSSEFPTDIVEAVLSYFQAAGFDAAEICVEPPDFLASELKLMGLLAFKEHECIQNRDSEQSILYKDLQYKFLQNHIKIWVPEYCQMLIEASRVEFYRYIARYLSVFLIDLEQSS
jgi:TorA maturation chaperone TorD